jgi:hypothetical protein
MSFATGGLYINESLTVAGFHQPGTDWDVTAIAARQAGAFPVRKLSSAQRSIREIVNRLRCLRSEELEAFQTGNRSEQASILWLAACRAYRFIAEFVVEVVADRYASLRLDLTYDDFDTFYAAKAEWSPKLAGLSQSTRAKLRAVLFRMMREANILSPSDKIMGAMLSSRLLTIIRSHNPSELRFFPGAVMHGQG